MPCSSCLSSNQAEVLSEISIPRHEECHQTSRLGMSKSIGLFKLRCFPVYDPNRRIGAACGGRASRNRSGRTGREGPVCLSLAGLGPTVNGETSRLGS
jgi:hypothetical protein